MGSTLLKTIYDAILGAAAIASIGGIAYYSIAISAARRLAKARRTKLEAPESQPPMTLLKPLSGADSGLEDHLTSFFRQDYPSYEIIFAVRHEADPAVAIARRLMSRYPEVPTRLILTGEPPWPNAKVYSMDKMAEIAAHQILVITDSDTSVGPDYLNAMARAFEPPEVGAVTNLYRGVAGVAGVKGADLWSRLEALGMSTEFMAGVIVAERLEGMKFTLGPSMAIRTVCLEAIGGFAVMSDYLADDFVLGHWTDEAGYRVALSTHVIDHHATAMGFTTSFKHRLRWNRSARFSRPSGYRGQGFTYGLPWAIALFLFGPGLWSAGILIISAIARGWLAVELAGRILGDNTALRRLWLIPFQDCLSFVAWLGGFLGREIVWRNERYRLLEGGRFRPVVPRE